MIILRIENARGSGVYRVTELLHKKSRLWDEGRFRRFMSLIEERGPLYPMNVSGNRPGPFSDSRANTRVCLLNGWLDTHFGFIDEKQMLKWWALHEIEEMAQVFQNLYLAKYKASQFSITPYQALFCKSSATRVSRQTLIRWVQEKKDGISDGTSGDGLPRADVVGGSEAAAQQDSGSQRAG